MRLQIYLLGLFSLVVILAACKSPYLSPPAVLSPAATPTPAQPIPLGLASVSEGLAKLRSYRASQVVEFEGVRAGQPVQGRIESLTEVVRQPPAFHTYLKITTPISNPNLSPGVSEFYRLGDTVYLKKGDAAEWLTFTDSVATPGQLGFLELERLITLPQVLTQPPRPELLNGQKVQRYSFTAADVSDPNLIFEPAQGDLWLADPGPFLAQYAISATLRLLTPDPRTHLLDQGHVNLRYTLTEANSPIKITLPDQALIHPLNALPRLSDARMVAVFPTFMEYTSAITAVGAAQFYRAQLPPQGWSEQQAELFNEKGRLTFAKGDSTLTVLITPADEKERVQVLVELKTP